MKQFVSFAIQIIQKNQKNIYLLGDPIVNNKRKI
jgi:hypothetical protein